MSLSSPASWAAEMNFQSRYPGGIVVTMICLAASCPNDEGAIHATAPVTATTATNNNAIRFMVPSLVAREHIPEIPKLGIPIPGVPAGPGDPLSSCSSMVSPACDGSSALLAEESPRHRLSASSKDDPDRLTSLWVVLAVHFGYAPDQGRSILLT